MSLGTLFNPTCNRQHHIYHLFIYYLSIITGYFNESESLTMKMKEAWGYEINISIY